MSNNDPDDNRELSTVEIVPPSGNVVTGEGADDDVDQNDNDDDNDDG